MTAGGGRMEERGRAGRRGGGVCVKGKKRGGWGEESLELKMEVLGEGV